MQSPALKALTDWLRERHARLQSLEKEAKSVLYESKDENAYRALMRQRAEAVSELRAGCETLLAALPDKELQAAVDQDLARFSAGGKNALKIGSVFYMSALLYPDDHIEGEPDNLERLINSLAER